MSDKEKNRAGFCDLIFLLLMLSSHLVLTVLIPPISMIFSFVSYQGKHQNEFVG